MTEPGISAFPAVHLQRPAVVAFEWGRTGADALASTLHGDGDRDGIAVVVDVLSFTTTLSVAADVGVTVLPHPWRDGAEEVAARHGAEVAVGRAQGGGGRVSLSPASMRRDGYAGLRLVLPSPNGATIARRLGDGGTRCVGASLRNATAVGRWIAGQRPSRVVVIAGGEQWPDGSLRPPGEDLWGAGAVIAALDRLGVGPLSVEATVAAAAYAALDDPAAALTVCASGVELIERGFGEDVAIAGEVDASSAVPVLDGVGFTTVGP